MVALCFSLQRIRKVFKNLNNDPKVRKNVVRKKKKKKLVDIPKKSGMHGWLSKRIEF